MSNPTGDPGATRMFPPTGNNIPEVDATVTHAFPTSTQPVVVSPPAAVPGYELLRELGRGGMGVVYLANQDGLNRQVALKMVLSGAHASETETCRFLAEAEAVASIRHPGVVQVFDFGTHEGRPYFALEYLPGGSLTAKLAGTPLTASDAVELVEPISRAVQAAHDAGVIHRDLKPGNILFDGDNIAKVTDFGLARKSDTSSGLTQTGAILGTPSYMAPEQAQGQKDVGPTADVYAVGAILYECLTGRPPFRAATPLETIHQVLKDEPVPPSRFGAKLPRDLETICLKCLNKDPRKRYPTALSLAEDLHRFQSGEPILARPVSRFERTWRWIKRNPSISWPALFLVLVLALIFGILWEANTRLQTERNLARVAENDANHQRQLAHARLEKAIDGVNRMISRVNSEQWAGNPTLQVERRRVLEDAVEFFQGFTGDDSTDPLVRKEMAKAQTRVAGAYLILCDLEKTTVAANQAIQLYTGLMNDQPDEPDHIARASEVYSLLGNTSALSAQYDEALLAYRRAVDLADAAREHDPSSANFKLRAVEARSALAYFFLQSEPKKGEKLIGLMMSLAEEIGLSESAKYEYRVALAFSLTVSGAYDLSVGQFPTSLAKYAQAEQICTGLAGLNAPSARAWDQLAFTRAIVAVQQGAIQSNLSKTAEQKMKAAEQLSRGIDLFDGLLRVNPKAFPYRLQKFLSMRMLAVLRERMKDSKEATRWNLAADQLLSEMLTENPNLDWIRGLDAIRQSENLIERIRTSDPVPFEAQIEKLTAVTSPNIQDHLLYNVACLYSVASEKRTTETNRYATKAVEILNQLTRSGYFKQVERVRHLGLDTDLDPLRKRSDFQELLLRIQPTNSK
jgi:serine/threonine protein kinase